MKNRLVLLVLLVAAVRCATSPPSPEGLRAAAAAVPQFEMKEPAADDALFVGAGDIANGSYLTNAAATAAIIVRMPQATVYTLGDNAYLRGTSGQFSAFYQPTWGQFLDRTHPAPGNHEYYSLGAHGYFAYFGARAGPPDLGWYSFDLHNWHIVSLNSEHVDLEAQRAWLEKDLRGTAKPCILAYWHHPLFSSGSEHGDDRRDPGRRTGRFWDALLARGADVVLNGHDHNYERFELQDASGVPSPVGLREFVAGTGGAELRVMGSRKPHSVVFDNTHHGVLLLTLHANSYEWRFLATDGSTPDASTAPAECHAKHRG
jgi:hypothetical protein